MDESSHQKSNSQATMCARRCRNFRLGKRWKCPRPNLTVARCITGTEKFIFDCKPAGKNGGRSYSQTPKHREHVRPGRGGTRRAFRTSDRLGKSKPWIFCAPPVFREGAENCARGGRAPRSNQMPRLAFGQTGLGIADRTRFARGQKIFHEPRFVESSAALVIAPESFGHQFWIKLEFAGEKFKE